MFCSRYQTLAAATEAETKDKVEQKKISGKRLAVRKHTYYSGFVHPLKTLDFFSPGINLALENHGILNLSLENPGKLRN